jgi:hypothetical protein
MNYGDRGKETTDEDQRVFARELTNEFGSKYFVLFYGGKPVDPGNMPHRNPERFVLRSVTEPMFRGYLVFLDGRQQRILREINRLQHI